jgi:hypothetical protein
VKIQARGWPLICFCMISAIASGVALSCSDVRVGLAPADEVGVRLPSASAAGGPAVRRRAASSFRVLRTLRLRFEQGGQHARVRDQAASDSANSGRASSCGSE